MGAYLDGDLQRAYLLNEWAAIRARKRREREQAQKESAPLTDEQIAWLRARNPRNAMPRRERPTVKLSQLRMSGVR